MANKARPLSQDEKEIGRHLTQLRDALDAPGQFTAKAAELEQAVYYRPAATPTTARLDLDQASAERVLEVLESHKDGLAVLTKQVEKDERDLATIRGRLRGDK